MADKNEEPVYASGIDVSANITEFAQRRSDIFGVGAEQTVIGQKLGEEEAPRVDPKAIWDGRSQTITQVQQAAQSKISVEQQLAEIAKHAALTKEAMEKMSPQQPPNPPPPSMPPAPPPVKIVPKSATGANTMPLPPRGPTPLGALPTPRPTAPMPLGAVPLLPAATPVVMMTRPPIVIPPRAPAPPVPQPPPPQQHRPPPPVEEPPAKQQRMEEPAINEETFAGRFSEPFDIKVQVPADPDKAEWKFNGQIININVNVTDQIGLIRQRVQEELGMPSSKQKFAFEGTFVKDSSTFAYYNIGPNAMLQLQVKERGGKKK